MWGRELAHCDTEVGLRSSEGEIFAILTMLVLLVGDFVKYIYLTLLLPLSQKPPHMRLFKSLLGEGIIEFSDRCTGKACSN